MRGGLEQGDDNKGLSDNTDLRDCRKVQLAMERERERKKEKECDRESVCVCERKREKKREGERVIKKE